MIAEGFLVLPFSRRDKVHTGHHPAVPAGWRSRACCTTTARHRT
ncbi:lysylphosphatidylglycerol biosynthesis bifunctional LysX domain protein [Mycobacterium avium subsp. avium 2285 (R)]|nr:lysylphosphatidylglycerol biosynthesis bifunctional LysX domain protein [Mycobacterium avium subsp. avium 2285 (R)]